MSISRPGLSLLALLVTGACTGADATPVTAPAIGTPVPTATRLVLQRVDERATSALPIDAWMGESLPDVLRARVLDGRGRPVAGVAVRFRVAHEDVARIGAGSPLAGDTAITTVTDADGVASAGAWMLPLRDTVATLHAVVAQFTEGDTAHVDFAARAWRDLSRYGGPAPLVIDRLPVERRLVATILPLGTFDTDDALPSADALLVMHAPGAPAVQAVADGVITELDHANGAITMRVRDQVRIRLGGVALRADLWVGRVLRAGDTIGAVDAARARGGLAVRVLDGATNRTRWVRPERYGARRTASFFVRYLVDSVRSEAYGLVRRAAPDLEGRIDYDRGGRLVGTWFDAASPMISNDAVVSGAVAGVSPYAATRAADIDPSASLAPLALTFAYDAERPGQVRIAAGSALAGALGLRGVRAVAWEDADPADVDMARGIVRYHLYATDDEVRMGRAERVLLVQLVDVNTLRAEVVSAVGGDAAGFSGRAVTLVR